jgi:hypothetical protein
MESSSAGTARPWGWLGPVRVMNSLCSLVNVRQSLWLTLAVCLNPA